MKSALRSAVKKARSTVKNAMAAGFALAVTTDIALAQGGLSKGKSVLEDFKSELTTIIPVIAIIALMLLGIGYASKFVEKETFGRWAVGIIVAGSAAQITAMFFT
ncbi:TrbC/VirB2 family protein [Pseudomonas protegens]|uniref:TrbC/VirB2 family protein n=1 Tax=Pseudomonas protegens TaxID=380021 RepID=UPI0023EB9D7D|nr:TrbC/VirB2 family protein [Pseudomonas protegens]MDF4211145.1 TrbC/VirB2 family protein [Pseudomonas protegens]